MSYYAVKRGRKPGIYNDWEKAKLEVLGFSKPVFKKFKTKEEAEYFIETGKEMKHSIILTLNSGNVKIKGNEKKGNEKKGNEKKGKPKVKEKVRVKSVIRLKKPVYGKIVKIFTDGACKSNGKKDPKAAYAVWFGDNDARNYCKKITINPTNQRAELKAIEKALKIVYKAKIEKGIPTKKVIIYTDSMYSIDCITRWIKIWKKNNYKTSNGSSVKNAVIIKSCDSLINLLKEKEIKIQFQHIKAHKKAPLDPKLRELWYGNDRVDKMASSKCLV